MSTDSVTKLTTGLETHCPACLEVIQTGEDQYVSFFLKVTYIPPIRLNRAGYQFPFDRKLAAILSILWGRPPGE